MMAQPPQRVAAEQVMKREYLFVVDVSGSMHGFPLDTAREVMRELLGKLRPKESFNILFFSGGSTVLSPSPLPATPAHLQRAMDMMKTYDGGAEPSWRRPWKRLSACRAPRRCAQHRGGH